MSRTPRIQAAGPQGRGIERITQPLVRIRWLLKPQRGRLRCLRRPPFRNGSVGLAPDAPAIPLVGNEAVGLVGGKGVLAGSISRSGASCAHVAEARGRRRHCKTRPTGRPPRPRSRGQAPSAAYPRRPQSGGRSSRPGCGSRPSSSGVQTGRFQTVDPSGHDVLDPGQRQRAADRILQFGADVLIPVATAPADHHGRRERRRRHDADDDPPRPTTFSICMIAPFKSNPARLRGAQTRPPGVRSKLG